jgi:hypothetical protein
MYSQNTGSTCEFWVNPVNSTLREGTGSAPGGHRERAPGEGTGRGQRERAPGEGTGRAPGGHRDRSECSSEPRGAAQVAEALVAETVAPAPVVDLSWTQEYDGIRSCSTPSCKAPGAR